MSSPASSPPPRAAPRRTRPAALWPLAILLAAAPPARALDVFLVCDTSAEAVWRVADLNLDGDYDDPGELVAFYDNLAPGAVLLGTNSGLKIAADGSVYVGDRGTDVILRLRDLNSDGDGHDPGEIQVFFDGDPLVNASGIAVLASNNFAIDAAGVVWAANEDLAGLGFDAIVRLEDMNADGDANDVGEARYYFRPDQFGAAGAASPQAVVLGPGGHVYYAESGTAANFQKGIYRLVDLDASGVIDQDTEIQPFFATPPLGAVPAHTNLRLDAGGTFYLGDSGNDVLWKLRDANLNGVIDVPGENVLWWSAGAPSQVWDFAFAFDGSLLVCEADTPDRLLLLSDADASGAIGPGETTTVYLDTAAAVDIGEPRAIEFLRRPPIDGAPMCAGDGVDPDVTTPCPCGNFGGPGRGCAHSTNPLGAVLDVTGTTSPDQLVLMGSGMTATSACIYLQGDLLDDAVFGDGVRCAGGQLIRLRTKQNAGGASQFPDAADTVGVSQRGMVAPGSGALRWYQVYYRNAAAAFCPPATSNVTSGWRIAW